MKNITVLLLFSLFFFSCSRNPVYNGPPVAGSEVVVDIKDLEHGSPRFFTHEYKGKKINFFVIRTGETVLSFLDACVTCYRAKRGYAFASDKSVFICRKCNMEYTAKEIEKGFGGCFPIKIPGHIQDRKYIIPLAAIEGMAGKF